MHEAKSSRPFFQLLNFHVASKLVHDGNIFSKTLLDIKQMSIYNNLNFSEKKIRWKLIEMKKFAVLASAMKLSFISAQTSV